MSTLSDDWRGAIDEVDAALIDGYQSGFPVEWRPFRVVAAELGIDEGDALDRACRLRDDGVLRRFGPMLNSSVTGGSALTAASAPEECFDEVVEITNGHRQVSHNYRRTHDWNMWFAVTADSRETRDRILDEVEEHTGYEVLNLPMLIDYYIDLEFPIVNDDHFVRESLDVTDVSATRISGDVTDDLSDLKACLLIGIQGGFPLTETPYHDVADTLDAAVDDVLVTVEHLFTDDRIKRIGCVIGHVTAGFRNNCVVVWNVLDDELDAHGEAVGSFPYVTPCYHRPRRPEQGWKYNLFTMIHGRSADAVDEKIDEPATDHLPFDHERLYSTAKFKQIDAQYEKLMGSDD